LLEQLVINFRGDTEELPGLAILESDFENPCIFVIGQRLDFRVKHIDGRDVQRGYKVLAIRDFGIALPAEDHDATPAASLLYKR